MLHGTMVGFNYETANAIEQILEEVETLLNNMIGSFYYSGEINAGEV